MNRTAIATAFSLATLAGELTPSLFSSQQGVPSAQPGPKSPQPRPSDPIPDPKSPQSDPKDPQGVPGRDTPKPPEPPAGAPGSDRPSTNPADRIRDQRNQNAARYQRPFAFQAPEYEAKFNESAERLARMELRMKSRQADALKRLGEVRTMPVERQNAALFDLLQQMIQDQETMNDYLVQARTVWSGDVELPADTDTGRSGGTPRDTIRTPETTGTPGKR